MRASYTRRAMTRRHSPARHTNQPRPSRQHRPRRQRIQYRTRRLRFPHPQTVLRNRTRHGRPRHRNAPTRRRHNNQRTQFRIRRVTTRHSMSTGLRHRMSLLTHIRQRFGFTRLTRIKLTRQMLHNSIDQTPANTRRPSTRLIPLTLHTFHILPRLHVGLRINPRQVPTHRQHNRARGRQFIVILFLRQTG